MKENKLANEDLEHAIKSLMTEIKHTNDGAKRG